MRIDSRRWRVVALLLVALVIALAGCGGAADEAAPDFSMDNAIGGTVELTDYSGEPVLLFFHMADG